MFLKTREIIAYFFNRKYSVSLDETFRDYKVLPLKQAKFFSSAGHWLKAPKIVFCQILLGAF
jgi:hypothetical protein